NVKPAVVDLVGVFGCESIVTVGGVVSLVQVWVAPAPALPAVSVAWAARVWLPSASPVYWTPLEQGEKLAPSMLQATVDGSFVWKKNCADVSFVGLAGRTSIVT